MMKLCCETIDVIPMDTLKQLPLERTLLMLDIPSETPIISLQNPPRNVRMLTIDLDDTVLDTQKVVRPEVAAALRHVAEAGILLVPATGRQRNSIPREILDIPGVAYCITSNGARVYDLARDEILLEDCFSRESALEILREAKKYDVLMAVYIDGAGYAQRRDLDFLKGVLPEAVLEYFRNARIPTDDLLGFVKAHVGRVKKISLHFPSTANREQAARTFVQRGNIEVTASSRTNLELNTKTANKGAAMLFLAERLGIGAGEIVAMGDSANDRAMLKAAGYAVVMDTAPPDIKELADAIAPGSDKGGAAVVIEAILANIQTKGK